MNIMTIPKKITNKGELVIIPRFEYEALLKSQQKNKSKSVVKSKKVINIAGTELEKELERRMKKDKTTVWKKGSLLKLV